MANNTVEDRIVARLQGFTEELKEDSGYYMPWRTGTRCKIVLRKGGKLQPRTIDDKVGLDKVGF